MKKLQLRNSLILLLTATIWGVAFVAQSVGMDYVGPFTFNCARFLIGGIVLIPCIAILDRVRKPAKEDASDKEADTKPRMTAGQPNGMAAEKRKERRILLTGGLCCGAALAVASSLQQIGIQYTTVGKAGFITACYILIVPILGLLFHRKCGAKVWIAVLLAVAGLYFLCMDGSLTIARGDGIVFLCAVMFAVHILVIDYFSPKTDGVKMACLQFLFSGFLCGVAMLIFEKPQLSQLLMAWKPILYAGVMSSGVGYTLQIVGQKGMNPTVASLIMSLESVISVLAGMVLLHQILSAREILGCVLMFGAILLAQLPMFGKKAA